MISSCHRSLAPFPKPITDEILRAADVVVIRRRRRRPAAARPALPGVGTCPTRPAATSPVFRAVRDDIHARVQALLTGLTSTRR